ncbi:MAG TPA: glycosyltransferase family 39 protein, partial [Anaerolineales bacterium]|nr:glycosyltransferase family 39 protein [Anaerolineales bacterium]
MPTWSIPTQSDLDRSTRSRRSRVLWIGVLLACLYIAWAIPFILQSSIVAIDGHRYYGLFDDAMISMRYAWNFSHGNGLVWNPGERVEGYTNLLWTLVMSVFTGVLDKIHAVLAIQILGIPIVLACCWLTWKLARRVTAERSETEQLVIVGISALGVFTYFPLSFWTLTGMETGFLTLLLLAGVYCIEGYVGSGRPRDLFMGAALLGLATLTRDDANILAVLALAYAALRPAQRPGDGRLRILLTAVLIFALFPVGRAIFRVLYYGNILPNTYYLKATGMPMLERLKNGWGFISWYFITYSVFLAVCVVGTALKPTRRALTYLAMLAAAILYQIWVGGDPVRLWRMLTPAQPMGAVLFALGAAEIVRRLGREITTPRGTRLAAYITAIAILASNLSVLPLILQRNAWMPTNFYPIRINAAVALEAVTTDNATVAVLAGGVVPYLTGRRAYDMLGRTDPYIASLPAD